MTNEMVMDIMKWFAENPIKRVEGEFHFVEINKLVKYKAYLVKDILRIDIEEIKP